MRARTWLEGSRRSDDVKTHCGRVGTRVGLIPWP